MRSFFAAFLMIVMMMISGCGGGGGGGGGSTAIATANISVPDANLSVIQATSGVKTLKGSVTLLADLSLTGASVELFSIKQTIVGTGCSDTQVLSNSVTLGAAQTYTLPITMTLSDSQACTPTALTLSWYQRATGEQYGSSKSIKIPLGQSAQNIDYNITSPEQSVTITAAAQSHTFSIYMSMLDSTGHQMPVAGHTVQAEFVPAMYGSMTAYEATTDSSGKATFTYTSPASLNNIANLSHTQRFYDKSSGQYLDIAMIFTPTATDSVAYLEALPSAITVTKASAQTTISLVALNGAKSGLATDITLSRPTNGSAVTGYGTLSNYSVTSNSAGDATVTYTAPSDITSINGRTATITATSGTVSKIITINFAEDNTTSATDYKINAGLTSSSLAVAGTANFAIKIANSTDATQLIPAAQVKDVNVTIAQTNMVSMVINGTEQTAYNYNGSNDKTIQLKAKTKSGNAILGISALVDNGHGNGKGNMLLTASVPVVIKSGPINSMSINKADSAYANGLFTDGFTILAADRYGNPANAGETVYVGFVGGLTATATGGDNGLLFVRTSGALSQLTSLTSSFTDASVNFSQIDLNDNHLVVLANATMYNSDYLGGWTIKTKDSATSLTLDDTYYGANVTGLSYVIGTEKRYDPYHMTMANAVLDTTTGNYTIGANGQIQLSLTYAPFYLGKDIYLYANNYNTDVNGNARRVGISIRQKLFGTGVLSSPATCDAGQICRDSRITLTSEGHPVVDADLVLRQLSGGTCTIPKTLLPTDSMGTILFDINNSLGTTTCSYGWNTISYEY